MEQCARLVVAVGYKSVGHHACRNVDFQRVVVFLQVCCHLSLFYEVLCGFDNRNTCGVDHPRRCLVVVRHVAGSGFVESAPAVVLGDVAVCLVGVARSYALVCQHVDRSKSVCHTCRCREFVAAVLILEVRVVLIRNRDCEICRAFPSLSHHRRDDVELHSLRRRQSVSVFARNVLILEQIDGNVAVHIVSHVGGNNTVGNNLGAVNRDKHVRVVEACVARTFGRRQAVVVGY